MKRADPGEALAAHGLRITRQRVLLLELLRRSKAHPTAIELHRQILAKFPSTSRKTVYEALSSLVNAGLASCVTEGGEPFRYEANPTPHYHGRCRMCGHIDDLPASADGPIRGLTAVPEGFHVEAVHVTLLGVCRRCRE
ncbi:MAG: transcriptional repressor [bacterium]